VIDSVHDLPNVLWEVANESSGGGTVDAGFAETLGLPDTPEWGDSTGWQYWVIDHVKRYEEERGYARHPIGMTMQFPVANQVRVNDPLLHGAADWISPGYDDEIFAAGQHPMAPGAPQSRWLEDPPVSDGRKVVISDTDHYAPGKADAVWAWKSFLRGHHPILMDFGLIGGVSPPDPSAQPMSDTFEGTRFAMGDTARYAERMALLDMQPRRDVSSTGYALARPGKEYLVLDASGRGEPFTVRLDPGRYAVEWFSVEGRETQPGAETIVDSPTETSFTAPFDPTEAAVLYLRAG
jgi:hypothetical protein